MSVSLKTDYTGKIYNKWKVIRRVQNKRNRQVKWLSRCLECGAETTVLSTTLKKGWPKSIYCKKCDWFSEYPEMKAYAQYYPNIQFKSTDIVFHLDGDQNNLTKSNLYLTSDSRVYWANLKMPQGFGMRGYNPELMELRRTALMLIDLECMVYGRDSNHKSWDEVYGYKSEF